MNPGDLPENLGRPMPEPDRATVEDHYTMAAITGLLACRRAPPRTSQEVVTLILTAKAIAREAMGHPTTQPAVMVGPDPTIHATGSPADG